MSQPQEKLSELHIRSFADDHRVTSIIRGVPSRGSSQSSSSRCSAKPPTPFADRVAINIQAGRNHLALLAVSTGKDDPGPQRQALCRASA
jgi:hypothetical protein